MDHVIRENSEIYVPRKFVRVRYYRLSLASPLEMYSKFVLPNWNLLGHMLKWVRKYHVTDHYFELCTVHACICEVIKIISGTWYT